MCRAHALTDFMEEARTGRCASRRRDVIYGTVRLIEADGESFLRWARQKFRVRDLQSPRVAR
jgi:hypothetical protein